MSYDADRAVAVLHQALAVCRGMLYSARTGHATQGEIERIIEGTGQESLTALLGKEAYAQVMQLSEVLPPEDRDVLLAIREEPYG
jgi:hypothetical protein